MRYLLYLIICTIWITGCISIDRTQITIAPDKTEFPQIIRWTVDHPTMERQGEWWLKEAKKRFVNPIIFVCHGGYETVHGQKIWYLYPTFPRQPMPVEYAAQTLANAYPNHDIIFVVCNRFGDLESVGVLNVKRIWYVPSGVVWNEPNYRGIFARWYRVFWDGKGNGSIWDFVSYDQRRIPTTKSSE